MTSESKMDSPVEENVKPKKKIVFAKDKKEAALAIIVMVVFVISSFYTTYIYLIEPNLG